MCGIIGCLEKTRRDVDYLTGNITKMTRVLAHRGPDDNGIYVDDINGVALGHVRLSIIDISLSGHQPMSLDDGNLQLVFNGEIYNHTDVKQALIRENNSYLWKGHSDTEILLVALKQWGVEKTLKQITGMFAFALWDTNKRQLVLARDRLGEKPLYLGWQGDTFVFASELKSIKAHNAFVGDVDRSALALLLKHGYVPAPYSIYEGIGKLSPGSYVELSLDDLTVGQIPDEIPYWSFNDVVDNGQANPFEGTQKQAVDKLDGLLQTTIEQQMIADTSLGAFLSGGIDSSTVVGIMQRQSSLPIKTFAIGFNEEAYNEAQHAKVVADHIGTEHTELTVSSKQTLDLIPKLPSLYDEPFADPSQIPTFLISEMTKQHVKVALTGDAGDELFGGYERYFQTQQLWNKIDRVPKPLRWGTSSLINTLSPASWDKLVKPFKGVLPASLKYRSIGDSAYRLSEMFSYPDAEHMYQHVMSHWSHAESVVIGAEPVLTNFSGIMSWPKSSEFMHRMMAVDTLSYLPDDIMVKVDRAGMAVGLETRAPFLDHNIVEFAWQLPLSAKVNGDEGKRVLREVLDKYVPRDLVDRPKMGLGVPIDVWLLGPLKDWAEALLDETRLRNEGYFRPERIRKMWKEHLSGEGYWQFELWNVLMFQAWLQEQ